MSSTSVTSASWGDEGIASDEPHALRGGSEADGEGAIG
jgi:hypothetical protein